MCHGPCRKVVGSFLPPCVCWRLNSAARLGGKPLCPLSPFVLSRLLLLNRRAHRSKREAGQLGSMEVVSEDLSLQSPDLIYVD